jgi:hypothetical protein
MASVRTIERTISQIEGFPVRMRHLAGRDLRSDRTNLPPYRYRRAMKNTANVRKWKTDRFAASYPGFDVDVIARNGRAVHGGTRLSTVRDMHAANPS